MWGEIKLFRKLNMPLVAWWFHFMFNHPFFSSLKCFLWIWFVGVFFCNRSFNAIWKTSSGHIVIHHSWFVGALVTPTVRGVSIWRPLTWISIVILLCSIVNLLLQRQAFGLGTGSSQKSAPTHRYCLSACSMEAWDVLWNLWMFGTDFGYWC